MKIAIELTGSQEQLLTETATRLNVPAADLAAAVVRDLVTRPEPDFQRAAERVLEKNRPLYERLR
jgi:hypothetical protein